MLKVAIVEDDRAAAELLENYLEKYSGSHGLNYSSVWFDNPVNFLTKYNASYDLVFLDIELPDINGMDVARKMREMDGEVALIFVTNMAQFAIKGYEVDASDFIVKPVTYYDFALKFEHTLKKLRKNGEEARLTFNADGQVKYIAYKDVYYVEVVKHKLLYHTVDGLFEVRSTLKKAEPLLLENHFAKCNNYCMVNLRYVSGIKGYVLNVSVGGGGNKSDEILISHPRKKEFVRALNAFLGENL